MPNIFDYLEWRGDVPFSADPFNEVDNLILSELAYTRFDGFVPADGEKVTLKKVRDDFFAVHSRYELMLEDNPIRRAPLLMDGMASGARFRHMTLSNYIDIIDADMDIQLSAVTYRLGDGTVYIAFRGTDSTMVGWKEDFNMSYLHETAGQRRAIEYLNEVGSGIRKPLRVGGHSKGGNFAVYASAFCDEKVRSKIVQIYTNDGPGFRNEVLRSEGYKSIVPLVISIVPDTSVIGMLLTSKARHHIVASSVKGFGQHDGLTWQVRRNRFVESELTELGAFIRQTQKRWLNNLDDEARENFVNTLFMLLEATGADTLGELSESKLKSAERILTAAQNLPKEKSDELRRVLRAFLHSGGQTVKTSIDNRLKEQNRKK